MALLDKFLKWKQIVNFNGMNFYQRVVPQHVMEEARKVALMESRKMRRLLRDPNSEEYLMYLDIVSDLDNADIIEAIAARAVNEAIEDYVRTNPRPVVPKPSEEDLEALERYQQEKEEAEKNYLDDLEAYSRTIYERVTESVKGLNREELEGRYKKVQTDVICDRVFSEKFESFVLANSLFLDKDFKKPAFSFEEFCDLPSDVRGFFRKSYNQINMTYEELKN